MPAQHTAQQISRSLEGDPDADHFSVPRRSIDVQKDIILVLLNAVGGSG